MKKIITAVAVMGLMTVSAFGLEGTIAKLKFDGQADTIKFTLKKAADGAETGFFPIVATTAETQKALVASVLTAKSTGASIDAYIRNINGVQGWAIIILK